MAHITQSALSFVNNSTYLLREGGSVSIRLRTGYASPYNSDMVTSTRVTVWCPTGNVFVSEGGNGIRPITVEIPGASKGPYQTGSERRTVAEYAGQPGGYPVELDIQLQAKPWAYSDEVVYFKVELLKDNEAVYADNGLEVNGSMVYPHINLRLSTSGGREEEPGKPTNYSIKPIGATGNVLIWTTPVPATRTVLSYNTTGPDDARIVIDPDGPVGTNAHYFHEALQPETEYFYFLQCANSEGDSGEHTYIGSIKTAELPTPPQTPEITSILTPNKNTIVVTFNHVPEVAIGTGRISPNIYVLFGRLTSTADIPENYAYSLIDGSYKSLSVDWLTPGETYTVYMTAANEGGSSAPTAKQTVQLPIGPAMPDMPDNVEVVTDGFINQTVSWDIDNPDVAGFGLYYSTDEVTWTAVQTHAPLPATARSWTQAGLAANTTYYWRVFSFNYVDGAVVYSNPTQGSGATGLPPEQPDAPVAISAVSASNNGASVFWTAGDNNTQTGFKLYRSLPGDAYVLIAELPGNVLYYIDRGLSANTTYEYAIDAVGYGGDVEGPVATVTTLHRSQIIHPVSGFKLHSDSRNRIKELAGRAIITSDMDRWVVRIGTEWHKAGLRPIRGATTLTKTTGGVLLAGVYRVYVRLVRGEFTRSIPLFASNEITIDEDDTESTLVVTPPMNLEGDAVECRDIGYDLNGNVIPGADGWEIYLAEQSQGQAYRIARLPLVKADWEDSPGSGTYTISAVLTLNDIFGGTRIPMEQMLESSLPPACWEAEIKDNRVFCTGEVDLRPTDAEVVAGAELTIEAGNDYFEVDGWDARDACVYHRLELDGKDTGWEVYDYDFGGVDSEIVTRCYIRHEDPATNDGGFNGESGTYTDFALLGNKNRVYMSAFYTGGAAGGTVFSPETFPPLTIAENEFFPDDNNAISCLIAVGELLLAGKAEKWIAVTGGDEPDVPLISTRAISRGSGVNAPFSVARDSNGTVYFMGDTGPFRVSGGGVEKINITYGNKHLFREVFDMNSIPVCRGEWFNRDDWYVVVGLNRLGQTGNRDGFILDARNGAIMPFTTPYEITHIKEYKSSAGEFQLLFGAEAGKIGYLFKRGLYVDAVDYTQTYPLADAEPIRLSFVTGVVDTEHALTPDWIQPRIKSFPADAGFAFKLEVDNKERCSDPNEFAAIDQVDFTTDTGGDHIRMASGRYNQMQVRLTSQTLVDKPTAYFELKELPMRVVIRHAS